MSNDVVWNDDEKVDQIKKWWKKYGNSTITIILIVMVGSIGWQFWNRHELKQAEQASVAYENLLASEQAAPKTTNSLAEEIKQKYAGTPYADFAAFILADSAVNHNDYNEAVVQLRWAVKNAASDNLEQLARIRLARVLMAQNQASNALKILHDKKMTIYAGLAAMVSGDAYKMLGNIDQARIAYQAAIAELPKDTQLIPLVNMKLNDLPLNKD